VLPQSHCSKLSFCKPASKCRPIVANQPLSLGETQTNRRKSAANHTDDFWFGKAHGVLLRFAAKNVSAMQVSFRKSAAYHRANFSIQPQIQILGMNCGQRPFVSCCVVPPRMPRLRRSAGVLSERNSNAVGVR